MAAYYRGEFSPFGEFVRQHAPGDMEGLFGTESIVWRISRESMLVAAGGRALLLQLAHPAVAEGVAQHSHFQSHRYQRGRRTFQAMGRIFFGDLETAVSTAQLLYRMHERVAGVIQPETSRRLANTPYQAINPDNLLWVWATLVDTTLLAYERLVHPLTIDDKQRFIAEMKRFAVIMGVHPEMVPKTIQDFERYFSEMISGTTLDVGQTARSLSRPICYPHGLTGPIHKMFTIAILPPEIREAYRFSWTEQDARFSDSAWRLLRTVVRCMPSCLRYSPAYHQARVRVSGSVRGNIPISSRLVTSFLQFIHLAFGR